MGLNSSKPVSEFFRCDLCNSIKDGGMIKCDDCNSNICRASTCITSLSVGVYNHVHRLWNTDNTCIIRITHVECPVCEVKIVKADDIMEYLLRKTNLDKDEAKKRTREWKKTIRERRNKRLKIDYSDDDYDDYDDSDDGDENDNEYDPEDPEFIDDDDEKINLADGMMPVGNIDSVERVDSVH